jgi:hypothetical protein
MIYTDSQEHFRNSSGHADIKQMNRLDLRTSDSNKEIRIARDALASSLLK